MMSTAELIAETEGHISATDINSSFIAQPLLRAASRAARAGVAHPSWMLTTTNANTHVSDAAELRGVPATIPRQPQFGNCVFDNPNSPRLDPSTWAEQPDA